MKKNILIAGILILVAASGIGVVVAIPFLQKDDDGTKTIKPKPESIALLPKKEPPKVPIRPTSNERKPTIEPAPKPEIPTKVEPEPKKKEPTPEPKKIDVKPQPKVEVKKDNKKPAVARIIAVGDDLIKLNDPDGEYTVKTLNRGLQLKLIGTIKTLKIAGAKDGSLLDAADLQASEIILEGDISDAQLTIVAKDVEFRGAINGMKTQVNVTLTKAGSLKLKQVGAGVRLHYSKANAADPEPRLELGAIDARAQVRMVPLKK